jgi:hypothetical protein
MYSTQKLYPGVTLKNLASKGEGPGNHKDAGMGCLRCMPPTAVLASLLIAPVAKAESPQLLPTHDVDITYDVTLPSQPRVRERVRWLAAEQLERVDGPHKSTTIFNRRTHEMIPLTSGNRTFLKLDMPRQPEEPAPEAILKRGNDSVVAGLHCVNWSWAEDVETGTVLHDGRRRAALVSH